MTKAGNYNPNFYQMDSAEFFIFRENLKFLPCAHLELLDGTRLLHTATIPLFEFTDWNNKTERKRMAEQFELGKQHKDTVATQDVYLEESAVATDKGSTHHETKSAKASANESSKKSRESLSNSPKVFLNIYIKI